MHWHCLLTTDSAACSVTPHESTHLLHACHAAAVTTACWPEDHVLVGSTTLLRVTLRATFHWH